MKHAFYVTNIHVSMGVITHNLVCTRLPGESKERYLEFSTYQLAEQWIEDERNRGNRNLYQIQKVYVP